MIQNVTIDELLISPESLFAKDKEDWENNEKDKTLFTNERFLPNILVEIGIAKSKNEIRKNRPDLVRTLDKIDFEVIKWGKKFIFIAVGDSKENIEKRIKIIEEENLWYLTVNT